MTSSLRVVLVVLGLSLLALAITGDPLYSRLSYFWGGLLIIGWFWSRLALQGIQVRRQAHVRRAQVGQVFEERFEVRNVSRLPCLWLEVCDRSSLPGSRGSRVLVSLGGRQDRSYLARTRLVQRGVFPLGPTEIASGDPFGLFPTRRVLPPEGSLLVYPMTVEVRAFPHPPGLLPGGEALRRRTHQVTPNAATVREYAPGDPLNRIHWPSTARRDRLMVKEFELDPLSEVWILVDGARDVQASLPYLPPTQYADALWHPLIQVELPPSTEEYAVSIAASLGQYFLRRGRAVGLVSCGPSLNVVPPDRGARQLLKILEALALLRAEGDLPLLGLVTAEAQHLPRGSTVVLITPSVQKEVVVAVDLLVRKALRPVVVLLDAASFGGAPGTADLAATLTGMGVSACRIVCGDDLEQALSQFVSAVPGTRSAFWPVRRATPVRGYV